MIYLFIYFIVVVFPVLGVSEDFGGLQRLIKGCNSVIFRNYKKKLKQYR